MSRPFILFSRISNSKDKPWVPFLANKKPTQLSDYHRCRQHNVKAEWVHPTKTTPDWLIQPNVYQQKCCGWNNELIEEGEASWHPKLDSTDFGSSRSIFSLLHSAVAGRDDHADSCSMYGSCPLAFEGFRKEMVLTGRKGKHLERYDRPEGCLDSESTCWCFFGEGSRVLLLQVFFWKILKKRWRSKAKFGLPQHPMFLSF